MKWRIGGVAALFLAALSLIACATYGHKQFRVLSPPAHDDRPYSLAYVELDDRGWFWDDDRSSTAQVERALALVRAKASQGNTVVLLFVHGWHHNASCCDDNSECFEATLARLDSMLNDPGGAFARARQQLHLPERLNLVGIYVGWRGKSLPMPLDYLTFWGRKEAASRVGAGDLRHLLLELQLIYEEEIQAADNYFGWVTVGHSFGGQAVLSAVSQRFEERFIERRPHAEVAGLGDLVVLVNPAVEAAAYRHIHEFSQRGVFPPGQKPILLIVSSEADSAVRGWFPLGRAVGFLGRPPLQQGQEQLEYTGLGVYPGQVTHRLQWVGPRNQRCDPLPRVTTPCGARTCEGCSWDAVTDECEVREREGGLSPEQYLQLVQSDLTGEVALGGVVLRRIQSSPAFSPTIVAVTDKAVVPGHSAIFTRRFIGFLSRYVGLVEAKHLVEFARTRARGAS